MAGTVFNDGSRSIEILAVSDEPDDEGLLFYFCRLTEDDDLSISYRMFDQVEMEIIRIADIKGDPAGLSEKEAIIRDIIRVNKGVMNVNTLGMIKPAQGLNLVQPPKYKAGHSWEDDEGWQTNILCVSPTPDSEGLWVYFHKNQGMTPDGERVCSFCISDEKILFPG